MRLAAVLLLVGCETRTLPVAKGEDSASERTDSATEAAPCDQTACGDDCVDTDSDPFNCGGCGRTCLITHGDAACDDGVCILATCDDGWGDCDADPANGCETASTCIDGAECTTSCGSTGATVCLDICAPTCAAPIESCNIIDDDCDGSCDEGSIAGCRQSVYRSSGALGHIYGIDSSEPGSLGQTMESAEYFFVYAEETSGLGPLYRCDKGGGKRFLTLSSSCEIGISPELVLGYIATAETCGAVPLYRLYNGDAGNHFYTLSAAERDNAIAVYGYRDEGVAGWVWTGR